MGEQLEYAYIQMPKSSTAIGTRYLIIKRDLQNDYPREKWKLHSEYISPNNGAAWNPNGEKEVQELVKHLNRR